LQGGLTQGIPKISQKQASVLVPRTEARQVLCVDLTVDHREAPSGQLSDEGEEAEFGRIVPKCEHRFSKEGASE